MDKWIISNIIEMITWLGFFCAIFFAYYYYLRFRNKERMALIEKSIDLSEIYKKPKKSFPWFMIGFTLLGIGIGFVIAFSVGFILIETQDMDDDFLAPIFISASILFGAIGIIVGHSIEQKKKNLRG